MYCQPEVPFLGDWDSEEGGARWEVVGLGLGRMAVAMHPALAPGLARRSCSSNRSYQGINILHQPPLLLILRRPMYFH